ncbi:methylated-DNA--[protein]-cysteine S-methyltransferase [Corynebacterium crudilactis]|uniref:Methylated-DNA--protein-cysteine methyltransferase n=1 Tax=Corynebacterium crudilactis TaxID=1652495 RepID=A0A172QWN2_9CORY|nr:methylated-DNA--[protein]-cysteine S-methyltransferase [Corynebacterium crudilactis]ANE05125.1 cysteine methyltransferase [Corynebacterium crudilactis]
MRHLRFESPIGELLLVASDQGLSYVAFSDENYAACTVGSTPGSNAILAQAVAELKEYFAGQRTDFSTPLEWPNQNLLSFRGKVQEFLLSIPYGESKTYKQIAADLGNAGAVRAVGSACATNPLPIFAPCHRVLRTDGTLGGYRGGLEAKQWLLELEKR